MTNYFPNFPVFALKNELFLKNLYDQYFNNFFSKKFGSLASKSVLTAIIRTVVGVTREALLTLRKAAYPDACKEWWATEV